MGLAEREQLRGAGGRTLVLIANDEERADDARATWEIYA
jgi:hypothetical protein